MYSHLYKKIKYKFIDSDLIKLALTHSSINDNCNERLEFLGDRVLNFVISDFLYNYFSQEKEGKLSERHAFLVSRYLLLQVAEKIELQQYIRADNYDGAKSVLANACEALIGAIYIDSGLETAKQFILLYWTKYAIDEPPKNYKGLLQEWANKNCVEFSYVIDYESGPHHNKLFYVNLIIDGTLASTGVGSTKKSASTIAAKQFMEKIL